VIRLANFHWPRRQVNRRLNVGLELLIQAADNLAEWAINVLRVLDRVTQGRSINAQELDVGARDEVACQLTQNEATRDGGNGLVNTLDHTAGGQPLLVGAVVLLQYIGGEGAWQVVLFKQPPVQVFELSVLNRMEIKRQIPIPPLFVQNALVLCGRNAAARASPHPDAAFVLYWWGVRWLDGYHGDFAAGEILPFDRQAGYG